MLTMATGSNNQVETWQLAVLLYFYDRISHTFRALPFPVINFDKFLADAACGVHQFVKPLKFHRVLLLIVGLLTGLQEEKEQGHLQHSYKNNRYVQI